MLQLAFGFEDDAVVDDLQGREVGALGDIVGERTGRDMEHIGILLDGVDLAEVLLQQLAEAHETAVGHTGDRGFWTARRVPARWTRIRKRRTRYCM